MKLRSLQQLFIEELQDLYSAEDQILTVLPDIAANAASKELREALCQHVLQTRDHLTRLDRIFDQLGPKVNREARKCRGMEGILKDGQGIAKPYSDSDVRDAGIIAATQLVEHYEISGYGSASAHAALLGHAAWAGMLQATLSEEKEADRKLTHLAERINAETTAA
jgi:ferritin-like metal-binding protein YciE